MPADPPEQRADRSRIDLLRPVWDGYLADPFLTAVPGGWAAYGTVATSAEFRVLRSPDLVRWSDAGTAFALDPAIGTDCWAPEVVEHDGAWWMYYSAGRGIDGHHLRVARCAGPFGPFEDLGVDLTPGERFAIDANPFRDEDGSRFLFFARDVLDADRPGTHLAVAPLVSPTELGAVHAVLEPDADWQVYERDRAMYGRRFDWHTLEGPTVVRRQGGYVLLYSGGSWEGPGYGVGFAIAPAVLGPWTHAGDGPSVLSSASTGLVGPGHNSVARLPDGGAITAFHAWDPGRTRRRMHLARLDWTGGRPVVS